jgi:hypothetical protein
MSFGGNARDRRKWERAVNREMESRESETSAIPPSKESAPIVESMPVRKALGRSTVEAYVGIIGGVGYAALTALGIPVNFWVGLVLWLAVAFCLVDLAWNSALMIGRRVPAKILSTIIIAGVSIVVLTKGWTNTHPKQSIPLLPSAATCDELHASWTPVGLPIEVGPLQAMRFYAIRENEVKEYTYTNNFSDVRHWPTEGKVFPPEITNVAALIVENKCGMTVYAIELKIVMDHGKTFSTDN